MSKLYKRFVHHTLRIVWHSVCRHRNYMKHLNTYASRCTVHTQVGETVKAPDPHPRVHVMAATQTPTQLFPLIIISTANLYAYNTITKHSTMVTLRTLQLDQYKCFMEVTLTHYSVQIKCPIVSGTLHHSVTTNHCPRVLKPHKNKCVRNKCNTCCIEHS